MTKLAHVFLALLFVLFLLALRGCGGVRAGTYNIRRFGAEATDLDRLVAIVEESEADVLALQEISSMNFRVWLRPCGARLSSPCPSRSAEGRARPRQTSRRSRPRWQVGQVGREGSRRRPPRSR
ncbi:MAG: hypothetical protein IPF92_26800 [Myxococcales bacterium]|nr:hypothetical protein [Myxococcales bacterium]MBL0194128.1 hypothetical protein [Myxococcales bacterium]